MEIAVVIPALNEAECIGQLVAEVRDQRVDRVIVVDNGSTDATGDLARRAGAAVVSEPRRGYGFACAAGASAAEGADTLVFLDGDYSFLPREIPLLLAPIREGRADLVLGSRMMAGISPEAMPFHQRFGNRFAAVLLRVFHGVPVSDLGPFRAITSGLMDRLEMREMTYGWPIEMILEAARCRARIVEVPISCQARRAGHSKVSGTLGGTLLTAYRIFVVALRHH